MRPGVELSGGSWGVVQRLLPFIQPLFSDYSCDYPSLDTFHCYSFFCGFIFFGAELGQFPLSSRSCPAHRACSMFLLLGPAPAPCTLSFHFPDS